jgi:FkbM family methyltransferase
MLRHYITRGLEVAGWRKALFRWQTFENWRYGEPELRLLKSLVDPNRVAIDVGAADGVYSYFISKIAKRCIAFEPNPVLFRILKLNLPNVHIYHAALSSSAGGASLRVPVVNGVGYFGWATIEPENTLSELEPNEIRSIEVPTLRGDDLDLGDVGFIKIDVEGHELSVLEGLRATIMRCRPVLLIEVSAGGRGNTFRQIRSMLDDLNYRPSTPQVDVTQNVIFRPY